MEVVLGRVHDGLGTDARCRATTRDGVVSRQRLSTRLHSGIQSFTSEWTEQTQYYSLFPTADNTTTAQTKHK